MGTYVYAKTANLQVTLDTVAFNTGLTITREDYAAWLTLKAQQPGFAADYDTYAAWWSLVVANPVFEALSDYVLDDTVLKLGRISPRSWEYFRWYGLEMIKAPQKVAVVMRRQVVIPQGRIRYVYYG